MRMTWLTVDDQTKLWVQTWRGWEPYDRNPDLARLSHNLHPEVEEHIGSLNFSDGWWAFLYLRKLGWQLVPPSEVKQGIWGRVWQTVTCIWRSLVWR